MTKSPVKEVINRIEAATVKAHIFNGPTEAKIKIDTDAVRGAVVEAIAAKSLDLSFDTSPLFKKIAKDAEHWAESTGRIVDPSEFDKIVGKAVKRFKEEQLGFSPREGRGR